MESGRRDKGTVVRATQIIVAKSKAYTPKDKYLILRVYTNTVVDLDKLTRAFGGNFYSHGKGHSWALQKKADVLGVTNLTFPLLPSTHPLREAAQDEWSQFSPWCTKCNEEMVFGYKGVSDLVYEEGTRDLHNVRAWHARCKNGHARLQKEIHYDALPELIVVGALVSGEGIIDAYNREHCVVWISDDTG